ncbi:DUF2783 domain-containing protein [Pseudomaricurvus alkylphenolicus]|jgi:hypothetical protein|uniref:DUF2783 domain-containing protein n=1 Tax=Pseudomaricurvus alkylphenolicus TaxID=1306991 RepID=UPI0014202586|nr:DUF2783 domain-containing protein [Pseudomaricurvus alkylphenolicus]NIB40793.1 DUF2783 domain-containing protein [Pseudomaricurvus alkylphenolicus]
MSQLGLSQQDIESIYDALAEAIDEVGEKKEPLLLAKLVLLLANRLGDQRAVMEALAIAGKDL